MKFKRTILATMIMPLAYSAFAGFEIEGTPALTTETGLMSNRTHYEQEAKANFRMPDVNLIPVQKKYEDANAKMVVDKAYRVVTHKGTGKAAKATGYADSVPLESALAMVIPAGWQVYQDADLKNEALPQAVSFEGGREWPDVLASLGEYNALRFHIDWYDKVVMMGQGRPVYTSSASRIRIIDEPVAGARNRLFAGSFAKPAVKPAVAKPTVTDKPVPALAATAVAIPAKSDAPIDTALDNKKGAGAGVDIAKNSKAPAANLKTEAKTPASLEPVKPVGFSLFVREGFLHENIVRLSKENGWNTPEWQIDGDFKVSSSFSVSGNSFSETIAKLLMIHPIEADVNTNQRKIYVTKEIQ